MKVLPIRAACSIPATTLFILLCLAAASCGAYEISGLVGDTSYERLEGVIVTLTGDRDMADTTDAEGSYAFTGLPAGDYLVEPYLEGWAFEPSRRTYTGLDADSLNQHFIGTQVEFEISGYLLSTAGPNLEGAQVALSGDADITDTSDAAGFYSFSGLPEGDYTVTPSMAGYDFSPASRTYTQLGSDLRGENFVATPRSGTVRVVGGDEGYVDPESGEVATVIITPRIPGSVRLTVYTLRGETLYHAREDVEAEEDNILEWDCRTDSGELVAPGVYVLKIDGAGMSEMNKVAVVR